MKIIKTSGPMLTNFTDSKQKFHVFLIMINMIASLITNITHKSNATISRGQIYSLIEHAPGMTYSNDAHDINHKIYSANRHKNNYKFWFKYAILQTQFTYV